MPARKVIYAADWLPLGELIWRNIVDSCEHPFQYAAFLPMNVDRMCVYWRNGWQ